MPAAYGAAGGAMTKNDPVPKRTTQTHHPGRGG